MRAPTNRHWRKGCKRTEKIGFGGRQFHSLDLVQWAYVALKDIYILNLMPIQLNLITVCVSLTVSATITVKYCQQTLSEPPKAKALNLLASTCTCGKCMQWSSVHLLQATMRMQQWECQQQPYKSIGISKQRKFQAASWEVAKAAARATRSLSPKCCTHTHTHTHTHAIRRPQQ